MYILGIGLVFAGGFGIGQFERALEGPWQRPAADRLGLFSYQVDLGTIKDKSLLKGLRRSDKFSRMSVLAAADAVACSGMGSLEGKRAGVILSTAFGPHVTTFGFLDTILDYGDANVSPSIFSNSVHNAAASYIAQSLNIQGPTMTITQFFHSCQNALQLARLWLEERRCDYVLAGAVDQYGDVMRYVYDKKLTPAPDGCIRPFNLKPTYQVPGEGAAFFLLGREPSAGAFCKVAAISVGNPPEHEVSDDVTIIDTDGMLPDESAYATFFSDGSPLAAYSPLFGSMMIGSAFNCAAGALMLKRQRYFANPIRENPHSMNLLDKTGDANIELIRCVRYNCHGEKAVIYLKKKDN
jgi:3-oxoacyl-[acyl-carrier-protein] synthase II